MPSIYLEQQLELHHIIKTLVYIFSYGSEHISSRPGKAETILLVKEQIMGDEILNYFSID